MFTGLLKSLLGENTVFGIEIGLDQQFTSNQQVWSQIFGSETIIIMFVLFSSQNWHIDVKTQNLGVKSAVNIYKISSK
jgi:hypothetical protein